MSSDMDSATTTYVVQAKGLRETEWQWIDQASYYSFEGAEDYYYTVVDYPDNRTFDKRWVYRIIQRYETITETEIMANG